MEVEERAQLSSDDDHQVTDDSPTNSKGTYQSNFIFDEIVYFYEERCIISSCSNHSADKCRRSKFRLFSARPEWMKVIERNTWGETNPDSDISICGQHFKYAEPTADDAAPSLFDNEALQENAGIPYKAQKWCCVNKCSNGTNLYNDIPMATRVPAVYYPLARIADDAVGRKLMSSLMSKLDVNGVEDHTSFICNLHLMVLHIDSQPKTEQDVKLKCNKSKDLRYTSKKYNIKLDRNMDTTDKSCCIIPHCVFSDIKTTFIMGDRHWRPPMFPFPSLFQHPVPRMIWLRLVREAMPKDQRMFCPSNDSKICGLHFPDGKPTMENPDPTKLEESESENSNLTGKAIVVPKLDVDASPPPKQSNSTPVGSPMQKTVQLEEVSEGKINYTARDDIKDIESDEELDSRLRQCQLLMDEDSEEDSDEDSDWSEKESDEDLSDDSNSSQQGSLQDMGRNLKRYLRSKEWRKATSTLDRINDIFGEPVSDNDGETGMVITIDREGIEKNITKESKSRALEHVKLHYLEEKDAWQLDIMLKNFNIIKDMAVMEEPSDDESGTESDNDEPNAKESTPLLSMSRKFKYYLKSLDWMRANRTLNRVTLLVFEAMIMADSKRKKFYKSVSRRQTFKTAEFRAVSCLRKQMESDNEKRLLNVMLEQFGRHASVMELPIRRGVPVNEPVSEPKPVSEPNLVSENPTLVVVSQPSTVSQSAQLMAEVKRLEPELILAASKVDSKKVSDILKQIGVRLLAVDKKMNLQQVVKDFADKMSSMELKQKALQYLKAHGILCQVKEEKSTTSISTRVTTSPVTKVVTTPASKPINILEMPIENTNKVVHPKVVSVDDATTSSSLISTATSVVAQPSIKRRLYPNRPQLDKNGMQTIYVHFNIEPPKKRKRKRKPENKTPTTEIEATAQKCEQPIPKENETENDMVAVEIENEIPTTSMDSQTTDQQVEKENEITNDKETIALLDSDSSQNQTMDDTGIFQEHNKTLDNSQDESDIEGELIVDEHCKTDSLKNVIHELGTHQQDHTYSSMYNHPREKTKTNIVEHQDPPVENTQEESDTMDTTVSDPKEESTANLANQQEQCLEIENQITQEESDKTSITVGDCNSKEESAANLAKQQEQCLEIEKQNEPTNSDFISGCEDEPKKPEMYVQDRSIDRRLETILDAETGTLIKRMKSELSDDAQYIVSFNATNFQKWKMITDDKEEEEDTEPLFPISSYVIKDEIDYDMPSLVYRPKHVYYQGNSDQFIPPIKKSNLFHGMADSYPGLTASSIEPLRRVTVFSFYDEFRPWLLYPFGRALRKLLLCTPVVKKHRVKPTEHSNNVVKIDLTDEEEKSVHELAKVLAKWEKVEDVNIHFNAIKIVANDLLGTSENGTFWNTFVDGFMEAVVNELPSIVAQCEEDIKMEIERKSKKAEVDVQDSATNPPPPPLKHGPSMQPTGVVVNVPVTQVQNMPVLSRCLTPQPTTSTTMPSLKPGIPKQGQPRQVLATSTSPGLVGPFTISTPIVNKPIVSKSTTGQQVLQQQPRNVVSLKIANSNIILLPTTQSKAQFVIANPPAAATAKLPIPKITSATSTVKMSPKTSGTPIIKKLPTAQANVTQVNTVPGAQALSHLMVPITMPGLQKGYYMLVPHTVNLNTATQPSISTSAPQNNRVVVNVNHSKQPITSTIPLVVKAIDAKTDAETRQGNKTTDDCIPTKLDTNTGDDRPMEKNPEIEHPNRDKVSKKLLTSDIQTNQGDRHEHNSKEKSLYQPDKLSSICQQVLRKVNAKEKIVSEESVQDEEPDEGSGSSSGSSSPPDKPSIDDDNTTDEKSSEKYPNNETKSDSAPTCTSNRHPLFTQLLATSSPPHITMQTGTSPKPSQTGTSPKPSLSTTDKEVQSDLSAMKSTTSLKKSHQSLKVPYLPSNKCHLTSTINSMVSNDINDIASTDYKQNTTISRGGILRLEYHKFWNSKFKRFEDFGVQRYEQKCKLHTMRRQLFSITSRIYKQLYGKGYKKNNIGPRRLDQSKSSNKVKLTNIGIKVNGHKQEVEKSCINFKTKSNSSCSLKTTEMTTENNKRASSEIKFDSALEEHEKKVIDKACLETNPDSSCSMEPVEMTTENSTAHVFNPLEKQENEKEVVEHTYKETKHDNNCNMEPIVMATENNPAHPEIKVYSALEQEENEKEVGDEPCKETNSDSSCTMESIEMTTENMPVSEKQENITYIESESKSCAVKPNEMAVVNKNPLTEENLPNFEGDSVIESAIDTTGTNHIDHNCLTPVHGCNQISAAVTDGFNMRHTSDTPTDEVDNGLSHKNHTNQMDDGKDKTAHTCQNVFEDVKIETPHNDLLHTTKKHIQTVDGDGCTCNRLQKYVCCTCMEVFLCLKDFNDHAVIHLSAEKSLPQFNCIKCHVTFTSKRAFDCHQDYHGNFKWNRCSWCGMMFNKVDNLEHHLLVHVDFNNEKIYECMCKRLFIGLTPLRKHMEEHFPEKGICCNYCPAQFHFVPNMRQHIEDVHQKPVDPWMNVYWRCHLCPKNYFLTSINQLNVHMESHNGQDELVCENCPKTFRYYVDYLMHCMSSCGRRIALFYECPICNSHIASDMNAHLKHHLGKLKKCHICLKPFGTFVSLKRHLAQKHRLNDFESNKDKSIKKPLIILTEGGQCCCMCGDNLASDISGKSFCSSCAKDCHDCPFNCGAKLVNQRELTSHFLTYHMDKNLMNSYLIVCPRCNLSMRNAGTMSLHWINHCPRRKPVTESNNNTDICSLKIDMFETIPDKRTYKLLKKRRKKKRKRVEHDDVTHPKVKKKKKHKKSKRKIERKLPRKPSLKRESHKKHRDLTSPLNMVPECDELVITNEEKLPVVPDYRLDNLLPTKRIRKKRVYEDMIEIPRSVVQPKVIKKCGNNQRIMKEIDNTPTIQKKPRRTSRISKPKEFPDYEENVDKILRLNRTTKEQKVDPCKPRRTDVKPERQAVKSANANKIITLSTDEDSELDSDEFDNYQESSPVKERVRPSNLRPRINSGHKWDLFHVDTIISTIDKLKMRLDKKSSSKCSAVKKKLMKNGKFLETKILQMKEAKSKRKKKLKTLSIQQIIALDHCYLGLPKVISKKRKGPIYAAPVDHDYVIGPRMSPSMEAEMELEKIRNEESKQQKERVHTSPVKSKTSSKTEDKLSTPTKISNIAASLKKKDCTFNSNEYMSDERDFDDVVKALLEIGCSIPSESDVDKDEINGQNTSSESNLDNDLVDFLANMVSMEENENKEGKVEDNLLNVGLSIPDSAILDGLSDFEGNTSGSQERIDWTPCRNIQPDLGVESMSNTDESLFQISNNIDDLSREHCQDVMKNPLIMSEIQEEAFLSNLLPHDVEQVLEIIADKIGNNNWVVGEQQTQLNFNAESTSSADDLMNISDCKSTNVDYIGSETTDTENDVKVVVNSELIPQNKPSVEWMDITKCKSTEVGLVDSNEVDLNANSEKRMEFADCRSVHVDHSETTDSNTGEYDIVNSEMISHNNYSDERTNITECRSSTEVSLVECCKLNNSNTQMEVSDCLNNDVEQNGKVSIALSTDNNVEHLPSDLSTNISIDKKVPETNGESTNLVTDKLCHIKELHKNVDNCQTAANHGKTEDVNDAYSDNTSPSIDKSQDSGVFILSDSEIDVEQV